MLKDDAAFHKRSQQILENREVYLPFEVTAEVVYVLEKVYKIPVDNISATLLVLIRYPNITSTDTAVLTEALNHYQSAKIDFVDAILAAYHLIHNHKVHTFDKKLKKLME